MKHSSGFALITVLLFLSVLMAITGTYYFVTKTDLQSLHQSQFSFNGFNAAEGGLNFRAELIKDSFKAFHRPIGTSPANVQGCINGTSLGTGDYVCKTYTMTNKQKVYTYVNEDASNPHNIVIPLGEPYAGLTSSEYRYTVTSNAQSPDGGNEAILDLQFKTRLVPLFQFLVFFEDDLELFSGTRIAASGPIHSNHDIYHAMQNAWWIADPSIYWMGPITSTGVQFRGLKTTTSCHTASGQGDDGYWRPVYIYDLTLNNGQANMRALPDCPGNRFQLTDQQLAVYNGNVQAHSPELTVPDIATFQAYAQPDPSVQFGFTYWSSSDIRFMLHLQSNGQPDLTNAATGIEVVNNDGSVRTDATRVLNDPALCPGPIKTAGGLGRSVGAKGDWQSVAAYAADDQLRLYRDFGYNQTIDRYETVLDVDTRKLMNCINSYTSYFFDGGADMAHTKDENGLVMFFGVNGPNSNASHNNYAVRFRDSAVLQPDDGSTTKPKGLTVVTDQKAVLWGDYNSVDASWIPSAVISDSQYVLSNAWTDWESHHGTYGPGGGQCSDSPDPWACFSWWWRFTGPSNLKINTAILSGVPTACGANGTTCSGYFKSTGGGYYGMFRFNETYYEGWNYVQPFFDWKGSIVSVHAPQHNQSLMVFDDALEHWHFSEPSFRWAFDTRFNDPAQLPPLTPRAVYNKQELFERKYEQ